MAQNINHHHQVMKINIMEQCQVAPPPNSVPSTTLPLTFLDIPWINIFQPVQRIFFYEFPYPTQHFMKEALPNLKHSLSLTLQHFFPFVANLIVPPHPHIPYIRYLNGDSLFFIIAEYEANFNNLVSDLPQDVRDWHPLVPSLPSHSVDEDGTRVVPLMAIQVTVIPNSGFSICLTFKHLVADGKSLHHFLKFWASVCKAKGDFASIEGALHLPFHDRDKVKDPKEIKLIYLQELRDSSMNEMEFEGLKPDVFNNKVRATITLTRDQVEKLKKLISIKCTNHGSRTSHITTFVVTCALMWICNMKLEENKNSNDCATKDGDELCYLVFLADCRDQLSLPSTYFGICIANGIVAVKRSVIVEKSGIIDVAYAIERKVIDLKSDFLKDAETLMSDYKEIWKPGNSVLVVAGSPKFAIYDTNFGWGRPKKSEAVHIDSFGSISLSDCRDKDGGVEIGLALERTQVNNFFNILEEQFNNMGI